MAYWMATTPLSLCLSPTLSPFKFKCYATQPQPQCSSVHNDDLQALLQAHHHSPTFKLNHFFLTSLFFYLQILPSDLHHNLLNQPNRTHLLEVILDLGRFPEARYLGKHGNHYLRNSEVTVKELEYAYGAVGEFGNDNRAGIEGTLHRISAIRSRNGGIVGLTCRIGRAVTGHIDMVYDLLQYGKSILFVGRSWLFRCNLIHSFENFETYVMENFNK